MREELILEDEGDPYELLFLNSEEEKIINKRSEEVAQKIQSIFEIFLEGDKNEKK